MDYNTILGYIGLLILPPSVGLALAEAVSRAGLLSIIPPSYRIFAYLMVFGIGINIGILSLIIVSDMLEKSDTE